MTELETWKKAMVRFWENLPYKDRQLFRLRTLKNCDVSPSTFYRWRTGATLPESSSRQKMNYIAVSMGYPRVFNLKKTI